MNLQLNIHEDEHEMDSSKEMKNENFVYNNDDKNMLDDFKNEIIKIINYFDKANQLELIEKEKLINENSELEVFCIKSKRDDSKIIIRYPKLLSKIFLLSQKDINFFINEITNELHKIYSSISNIRKNENIFSILN